MKKLSFLLILCLGFVNLNGQENEKDKEYYPLIGNQAPEFKAKSTEGNINFPKDFEQSWKILFSHPQDFTPVCTSEILELCRYNQSFEDMDVKIAVLSTDMLERHENWKESIESLTYKDIKNPKVNFPLIADPDLKVSKQYGMIHPNMGTTKDVRGVFIIDPNNNIRSILFYPMEIGRNFDEIQRTVAALQKHDKDNVLTPANWTAGTDVIVPYLQYSPQASPDKAAEHNDPDVYSVSWYLHMKKDNQEAASAKTGEMQPQMRQTSMPADK